MSDRQLPTPRVTSFLDAQREILQYLDTLERQVHYRRPRNHSVIVVDPAGVAVVTVTRRYRPEPVEV